jgi:hypothetical protein
VRPIYFASNLTKNQALSFGSKQHGEQNIFSTIALAPAHLFGVHDTYAMSFIGSKALKNTKSGSNPGDGPGQASPSPPV